MFENTYNIIYKQLWKEEFEKEVYCMWITEKNFLRKSNQGKKEKVCNDIEILKISCMIDLVFPVLRQGVPSWARASFPSLLFFKVQAAFEPAEIDCFIRSISNQN